MNLTSDIQALNEMLRITTRQVETITEKDTMNNVLVRGMRTTVTTGPRGGTTIPHIPTACLVYPQPLTQKTIPHRLLRYLHHLYLGGSGGRAVVTMVSCLVHGEARAEVEVGMDMHLEGAQGVEVPTPLLLDGTNTPGIEG
ncbi:unnamed protein product [Alternaria alternata]